MAQRTAPGRPPAAAGGVGRAQKSGVWASFVGARMHRTSHSLQSGPLVSGATGAGADGASGAPLKDPTLRARAATDDAATTPKAAMPSELRDGLWGRAMVFMSFSAPVQGRHPTVRCHVSPAPRYRDAAAEVSARYRGYPVGIDGACAGFQIRAMGIGLLGPLQIDGSDVGLGRRDRVVLAVLAVAGGEPVSTDRISDALWGATPPASAAKVVQGCVVRLRRLLGHDAVVTTAQGYRLDLGPDQLDTERFERGVARARELLAAGELDRAGFIAEEARRWWRGPPLADLESWSLADGHRAHLEELRLQVEEIAVEAQLRSARSPEVLARARELAQAAPLREHRWVLLARAQYQSANQATALATLREVRVRLQDELGLDPGPELVALEQAILNQDPSLHVDERDPEVQTCPYRGLAAYDADDADLFFGRAADVAACLATLRGAASLSVVGPSGSGKSSLLRAGVTAALRAEGRRVEVLVPGARLERTSSRLPRASSHTVVVIDQFEEVFTVGRAEERRAFVEALRRFRQSGGWLALGLRADRLADLAAYPWLAREVEAGLHLLAAPEESAIREIVEAPAHQAGLRVEPGLVELLVHETAGEPGALPLLSHCLLETWGRREGRTLTVAGYRAVGGISGAVRQSAEGVYAALPPSQRRLLRELLLRLVGPGDHGGVVRHRAPLHTVAFDREHTELVDRLVASRLVTVTDGQAEIAHEALAQAWPRLRTWLDEDVEGVRIQHHLTDTAEGWDRLGRPASELYRGVRLAQAGAWVRAKSPRLSATESDFLRAAQRQWKEEQRSVQEQSRRQARDIRRLRVTLTASAVLLVLALVAGFTALRQAQTARDSALTSEARRLGAAALATSEPSLSLLLAVAGHRLDAGPSTLSNLQAAIAARPALVRSYFLGDEDLGRLDVAPGGRSLLVQDVTNRVWRLDVGTAELGGPLEGRSTLSRWVQSGWPVEHSPEGDLAVVGPQNLDPRAVLLVDPDTLEPLDAQLGGLPQRPTRASDVAFSADGRYVAAALQYFDRVTRSGLPVDAEVRVWDLRRRGQPVLVARTPAEVSQYVALSPDGDRLYTSLPVRTYDIDGGQIEDRAGGGHWLGLEIDPAGRLLAHPDPNGDGVVLRSAATLEVLARLGSRGDTRVLRFSHDGRLLASASTEGTTTVWDVARGVRRQVLPTEDPAVLGLGFSPDDAVLYTAGHSGTVRVWDLRGDRRFVQRLVGVPAVGVTAGAGLAAPTGESVAYIEAWPFADKAPWVRFLDLGSGSLGPRTPLTPASGLESGLAWSPDGTAFAVADREGVVQVLDPRSGRVRRQRDLGVPWLSGLDFTPSGRRLVYGSQDGPVGVVDARTLRGGPPAVDLGTEVCCVAAAAGSLAVVVLGGRDHESEYRVPTTGWALVDLAEGRVVHRQDAPLDQALTLDVSPDGERVVFGGQEGRLSVHEVDSGRVILPATPGHEGAVLSVDFSPDGRRIVTGGVDGTVRLWSGTIGAPVGAAALSRTDSTTAWFDPDSSDVLITTHGTGVHVWPTDSRSAVQHACAAAGRDLSRAEWQRHIAGHTFRTTCSDVEQEDPGTDAQ